MLRRLLTTLFVVVGVAGLAQVASAQYMYLDSNANGIHDSGDVLKAVGDSAKVDVYLVTNKNRAGVTQTCDTGDGPLTMISYAVNLQAVGGSVTFQNFINQQPVGLPNHLGLELNPGNGNYKNAYGGSAPLAEGSYKLMSITIVTVSGSPHVDIVDIANGSQDFTSFGCNCSGNDFDNTYKLTGPGGGSDWTDVDGLGAPAGAVNNPPVLTDPGNRTVNELSPLAFTLSATDPDAGQIITYSMDAGFPVGATINGSTGAFAWTPTEAQGPGSFPVTFRATDNGTAPASATRPITITVNEVNVAPVVTTPGNKTIAELTPLAFTVTASDADLPANTITWSLTGAPAGATIGAGTGAFAWTPTEAQGPGLFPVTITATDNGVPPLAGTAPITITVSEVNQAPVLNAIGPKSVTLPAALAFTATATDADVPANTLTFSLDAGAPAGATIGASTGAFAWTPAAAGTFPVTVRVTDNGTPALNAFEVVQITVNAAANQPPVVTNPGNKTVAELAALTFTVTATDPNSGQTLTYSLDAGAPAGATINSANGAFSWTPTEAQGPGTFPITIRATDNGSPVLSGTAAITVTVTEVNVAPVVTNPGNKTTNELAALTFTVTATDADLPANTIAWSLDAGAPAGATIGAGTGAFAWTPTEAQGPGTFPVTIRATDNGSPALAGTAAITITVNEVNVAPVVTSPGNRTTNELAALAFTVTATDADLPANTLTWTLDAGAPAGATINSSTGAFAWTPTEAQGPGSFPVTIRATDNGTPALAGTAAITITVNEVNSAPVLNTIGNKVATVGVAVAFTATATDADVPANTLTFSLDAGAPAGATIGASTGAFSWTPAAAGTFPVTVRVTDNGSPALNDFEAISIVVSAAPNQPPVVTNPGNKTVNELAALTFTVTATDPNSGDVLTFSLDAGSPAGATIGGANGAFSWTPTEAQGPGTFPITIRATDNGSPTMSGTAAITVTVNEVNVAPVVTSPGNKTIAELANLAFTVTATDADVPANTIAWSLTGAPAGATIGASTGAFSWTPTEAQGPGSFPVTITATDNGSPVLAGTAAITITVTEVNSAPVVTNPGDKTVNELSALTFTVTATDADLPANTIAWSLDAGAPAGATIGAGTGAFAWTPTEAQGPGAFPITIRATDNGSPALSGTAAITVTVNEVNVAPIVTSPGNRTVNELTALAFTVTATDADLPANTLTWSLDAGAPAGATIGAANGAFSWTPLEIQGPGSFPVTIRATDNGSPSLSGTAAITITVNEVNQAPVLNTIGNKAGTVGVAITFTATATDADIPANGLTFSLDAGAPSGAAINAGTGAFSWTPAANGTFPVTVRVTDNGSPALNDFEAISITVSAAPNQAPVVTNPGNKTVNELAALTFTVTATDPNSGDVLTFSLDAGAPAGATIGGSNGAFSWTPTEAQGPGTFPITIRATDNGSPVLSGSAAITVTVNEVNVAPVVTNPGNKTIAELANLAFTVAATDADLPANTLTFSLDAGAPAGSTINPSTGAFSWTPTEAQGPGSFPVTIRATDNGSPALAGTAAITISVTEVNSAPVVTNPGDKTVNELSALTFTVTATDADVPANTISWSLTGAPAGATIGAGTGAFAWTPTEAQGPGSYPVTITATDNGSPVLAGTAAITITVNEVNVAPVVTSPGNKTVNELANLAFTVTATDADVPANTLTWSLDAGAPAGATIGAANGAFSWTPLEIQGPGSFPVTIRATDNGSPSLSGTAAITITVNEVNQAPVLNPIGNKAGTAGVAVTFTATATDADIPANGLTFSLDAGAPSGAAINAGTGAFSWTPSASGTFPVTVRVTDNGSPALSAFEVISIVIGAAPNNPPVVTNPGNKTVNELAALTFTVTATDPDAGQTRTFSLDAGAPTGATINGSTGAFSWTPTEAQGPGTYPITIRATDNGTPPLSGTAAITVTVNEVNVAPVVTNPGNKTINELVALNFTVTATDADVPANTIAWSLDAGAPAGATIGAGTGAFSWTPTEAQGPGSFPVTIRATDNGSPALSGTAAITITVNEVNVAPVLAAIGNKTVNEQATLAFTATATDSDVPANTLTFSLDAGAPAGAAITGAGAFSFTPTEAQGPGSYPVTVRVTDNGTPALSAAELITITVNEVNVAPVVTNPGNKTVNELTALTFTVTATDSDLPAQTIAWSLDAGAPAGASINGAGGFSWTPTEAQGPGSYPVTIRATDSGSPALSGTAAITITVNEVNVAPVLASIGNKSATVGVALTFTATATDADIPANALSFSLLGAPAGATINASTGAFSWTPSATGSFPVTVRVTDNGSPALSGSEGITITVGSAPNQAPVLGAIGNKTVNELATLAFTATATDPDAGQTLTFSLDAGAPAGATIGGSSGAFSWTPTESQGPASTPITVRVTDNGSPVLSDFEAITVTVNEVNVAPVVANPGNKTVDELAALSTTLTATDADLPANTITWSVDAGAPAGLTINASTGVASWTPTEAQGPGSYPVTFRATDNGTPAMSGTAALTITVNEVNVAPVMAAITNKSVAQGTLLAFTATATDADIPANTLAFSLDAGAPAGATINASTGAFSWTPPAAGSFPITARVTDNGVPALSSSQSFTVNVGAVNNAPVLTQPSNMTVNEGATADQTLTATDPDAGSVLTFSKVSGPAFMTVSGAGVVHLAPGSTDAGSYTASVKVSDNGSPSLSDTKSFSITVNETNRAPVANADGPYTSNVGGSISFNGTGSSDPDGDALTYAWNFGDGSTGTGATPSHAYSAVGVYTVSLTVTDPGMLSNTATTTATVADFFAASVFFYKNVNYMLPQLLGSYIRFEPIGNSFNVNDVILSSSAIRLTYNGVTKNANCKNILDGDSNKNGKAEIRACFTQSDMKALFTSLPNGTTDVTLTLEADLASGGKVRGTTVAHVVKFSFLHAGQLAQVSPNPLNPQAKLSFVVTKPGVTTIQVFDINGRLVRNLMQRQYMMPGVHDVTVDGRNESGNKLASGVYYYRVQSADVVTKGSFIVMK